MYPELAGKVAIVTGSGRPNGLGQGIAKRLAAEGAKVVIHDLGHTGGATAPTHGVGVEAEMDQIVREIREAGGEATGFPADLMIEAEIAALVAHAVAQYGRLDILVNNAGIGYLYAPTIDHETAHWDAVLGVNLRAAFLAMKHAIPHMRAQGKQGDWGAGRIVSIASQAAKSGFARASSYTASKHALVGLTRAAAVEFGGDGITVNTVCPNHVTTGLGAWQNDYNAKARGQTLDELMAIRLAKIPLGRTGAIADTANACAFLCSTQAAYITGEAMNVSGGEEYH